MDEREWAACRDPDEMLTFLHDSSKVSERKARLFLVAVCRRISDLLPDQRSRDAVEVAERFADGLACRRELGVAQAEADACCMERRAWEPLTEAAEAAERAASPKATDADFVVTVNAKQARATASGEGWNPEIWYAEEEAQADLLRDILGPLPFRTVLLPPSVWTWNDNCIPKLATTIYEERSLPEGTLDGLRLGVLADALEEAGVTDQDILGHLRQQGAVHVRGCFGLDLLLGKE